MRRTADRAVVITASFIGLWAGFSAPAVSPVLPEAAAARSAVVDLPAGPVAELTAVDPADPDEATTDHRSLGRAGRGER